MTNLPDNFLTKAKVQRFERERSGYAKYTLRTHEALTVTGISSRQFGPGVHLLQRVRTTYIMQGIN